MPVTVEQGRRTRLSGDTTALFVLDALEPVSDDALHAAAVPRGIPKAAGHIILGVLAAAATPHSTPSPT